VPSILSILPLYVAVMYSTWPRVVIPWRCAKCLHDCALRSTKMSSCRAADALLARHVGIALMCIVCLSSIHRFVFHRRSLVRHLILGYIPRLRKMLKACIAAANDETKPLMLGSVSFGNSALQNCCKL